MQREAAMAFWLYKSEPDVFSWDDLVKAGKAGTEWTGVRNYSARNFMRAMKKGDRGFYYHSGGDKAVVGIVEVVKEAHPDSTDDSGQWDCVDIRAIEKLPRAVTLAEVKADKRLAEMALVRLGRLSVQPVTEAEWKAVSKMGGL
jgi:predicted RNA-binding protein with PUA-like domain